MIPLGGSNNQTSDTASYDIGDFEASSASIQKRVVNLEKHGIKINNSSAIKKISAKEKEKDKISFGFYHSLILFIFFVIALSRILYFSQGFIVSNIPASEYYLDYFFESIRNIFEIWKNLITNY